jgi:hypothetical protein
MSSVNASHERVSNFFVSAYRAYSAGIDILMWICEVYYTTQRGWFTTTIYGSYYWEMADISFNIM